MKADDASGSNIAINSVIKITSFLQRALDKGRSNYMEMSEVSKYINQLIQTNVNECLNCMKSKHIKGLRNDLLALFNELLTYKVSYEHLITANCKIDKEKLRLLFDLDNDIIDLLKNIKYMLTKDIKIEEKEIRKLAVEIEMNLIKKKDILLST